MKKKYFKPAITIIPIQPLCSNGLTLCSVEDPKGKPVDHFKVVEEEESQDSYDWGMDSWGGN